jgi:hypothetical protein
VPMLLFAKGKLTDMGTPGGDFYLCWKWRIASVAVNTIIIVISPLNSLMRNQISRLSLSGIRASVVSVKASSESESEENMVDVDAVSLASPCRAEKNYERTLLAG